MRRTPEQAARDRIDAQLADCGWIVHDSRKAEFSAGRGIALREVRMSTGPCDYLLLVEERAWLGLSRDHIATSLSIEPDGFEHARFSHRGSLGKVHPLFGNDLPRPLDESNEALAA